MQKVIPNKKALAIVKEIPTEGHSPLKIITNEGEVYFIKNSKGNIPDYSILNEFICYFLLNNWEIPTPDIASIYIAPILIEKENFSIFHKPHYYNTPVFGSKKLENSMEMNSFISLKTKTEFNKFSNPLDLLKIGLFDIWVENTDRKPTNNNILIQTYRKQYKIIALDHAFAFDTVKYEDLNVKYIVNTWNDSILETSLAKDIIHIARRDISLEQFFKDYFYICIRKSEDQFNSIIEHIPEEFGYNSQLETYVKNFLFNEKRNKLVLQEFITRIK